MNYTYADKESSSNCESGWTFYLNHSSISSSSYHHNSHFRDGKSPTFAVDGYEDLSMISDASSGPPNFGGEIGGYCGCWNEHTGCSYQYPLRKTTSYRKREETIARNVKVDQSNLLDDTASSPFFDFSDVTKSFQRPAKESAPEYSQGHSSKVRGSYEEQYNFFPYSTPADIIQHQNQLLFEGKRWW